MELAILLVLTAVVTCFDYWAIQRRGAPQLTREDILAAFRPRGWKQIAYFVAVPISGIAVSLMLSLFYQAELLFAMKRLLILGVVWPVAVSDYREYKIPNKLILLGLALRVLILIPEALVYGYDTVGMLLGELCAAAAMIVLCIVCMIVSRGSMGMGDLKLLAVIALYLGVEGIVYTMFFCVLVSFVVSVILLLTKKKNSKDAIPFAPFILAGLIISLILSGT